MTYGDLYDAIPLAFGLVGGAIGLAILVGAVVWRRFHPRKPKPDSAWRDREPVDPV